jgi:release factor glutamine methyltransferase
LSTWTIKAALEWTTNDLARSSEKNPRLAAQWLLCAATGFERIELYTRFDQPLSSEERAKLRQAIERRRAGEPLQYILGKAPFRHLDIKVRSGVLIPRPETEVLVDLVLKWEQNSRGEHCAPAENDNPTPRQPRADSNSSACCPARIIDLCTGSGCIALSLVHEHPSCHVTAIDIDPAAVTLAQENAATLAPDALSRLTIQQGDLATELLSDSSNHAAFDVIVANPPYIPSAILSELPQEVAAFEPQLALDGGADGLDLFRRIVEQATILLKPGGLLAVELHEDTLDRAATIAKNAGFNQVEVHPDLTQRPRFLTAEKPKGSTD